MNHLEPTVYGPRPTDGVRYEPGLGWICSCTNVYVERVDFDLDCHHWPLCEHIVSAAKKAAATG
jgi:hypothetical protein